MSASAPVTVSAPATTSAAGWRGGPCSRTSTRTRISISWSRYTGDATASSLGTGRAASTNSATRDSPRSGRARPPLSPTSTATGTWISTSRTTRRGRWTTFIRPTCSTSTICGGGKTADSSSPRNFGSCTRSTTGWSSMAASCAASSSANRTNSTSGRETGGSCRRTVGSRRRPWSLPSHVPAGTSPSRRGTGDSRRASATGTRTATPTSTWRTTSTARTGSGSTAGTGRSRRRPPRPSARRASPRWPSTWGIWTGTATSISSRRTCSPWTPPHASGGSRASRRSPSVRARRIRACR